MEKPQQRNTQKATRQIKEAGKEARRYQSLVSPPPPPPHKEFCTTRPENKEKSKIFQASTLGKLAQTLRALSKGGSPKEAPDTQAHKPHTRRPPTRETPTQDQHPQAPIRFPTSPAAHPTLHQRDSPTTPHRTATGSPTLSRERCSLWILNKIVCSNLDTISGIYSLM